MQRGNGLRRDLGYLPSRTPRWKNERMCRGQVKRLDEFACSGAGWQLFLCSDHDRVLDPVPVGATDSETKPPYFPSLATLMTQASFLIPCPSHGLVLPPYGTARTTGIVYLGFHPRVQLGQ